MAAVGKRLLRGLRRSRAGIAALSWLAANYIRFCGWTTRWVVENNAERDRLARAGEPFIAAIWHGRLFFSATWAPEGRRTVAMISSSGDGEFFTRVVAHWNVTTVRGSTYDHAKRRDKGGGEAYREGHHELRERNAVLAITPDGPRGPLMRAQIGVAKLAIEARVPVVPVAFATRSGRLMRSWDRFLLPLPFSRGVLVFGDAIAPPEGDDAATVERHRRAIETALTAVTHDADRRCGRPPVLPAPEEPGA